MKKLFLLLFSWVLIISSVSAQTKASIERVDVLDKKNKLILPEAFKPINNSTYKAVYLYDEERIGAFIGIKSTSYANLSDNPDYVLQATTVYPAAGKGLFQIAKLWFEHPLRKSKVYYAVFTVFSKSDFSIKDKENKILKRFILNNKEYSSYYYCKVDNELKLLSEREFEYMKKNVSASLGGFNSIESLNVNLVSTTVASSDKRTTKERNIDFIKSTIKQDVIEKSGEIANLLFATTSMNAFLQGGFKMHVLKKSSVKSYPDIASKTDQFQQLADQWSSDIDNSDMQLKLAQTAAEFEKLADESDDANIKVLCYSNASLAYIMSKDLEKSKSTRAKAVENDNSVFGVLGSTVPNLYAYLYKRNVISNNDEIDYNQFIEESKIR